MQLVFATNNQNKLAEIKHKISDTIKLFSLQDINYQDEPEENGDTFYENATIKVQSIWNKLKINCFAEDSGLVVNALNGEPGILSARYSGERNDQKNIEKVLTKLENITDKSAYFITVIALIINGNLYFFEGRIEGEIIDKPIGNMGFGYDPIFVPNGFSKSFAEMSKEEKNHISHRAIATEKLIKFLENYGL